MRITCARLPSGARRCEPCGLDGQPCCFIPGELDCDPGICELSTSICGF
jgi:hypothetical protein